MAKKGSGLSEVRSQSVSATKADPGAKPHFHGHRQRLREKFDTRGADALAEYEILEMLLFRTFPRLDTKPLAKALIDEFGSLAEVLSAPKERLMEVKGIGTKSIVDLKLVHAAGLCLLSTRLKERPLLSSWSQVLEYCRAAQAFEDREIFRILFLDKKNQLIKDEVQQTGTVDHTPVYPREIAKRALELSATAIILVHNHPSGDPTPSTADIQMTKTIIDILKPLGIEVHDHIIIGRQGHASLRGLRLL